MFYKTPGFILSIIFMYWMPRHRLAWWEKYNYVLSAALSAGVSISAFALFFAVKHTLRHLVWLGNTVSGAGIDGTGAALLPLPERGYFGPEKGTIA